ncbi:hypothetical protein TCAL_08442 [Tigriopus californicus]|uniref:Serine/threonine-protein phosphatase 4 regulatory subunit 3-like central domain-containing protein n=1 Tax=Tigriopus californicus TaxID=6832 RepID=A0A553P435_TIGCA|nr:hypothetical protein TCAL_08442 [Tigriopus californicus]
MPLRRPPPLCLCVDVDGWVQGKDPSMDFTQDIVEESEDERFDEMMSGSDAVQPIELPPCEIGRLEEISELVSSCLQSPMRREKLAVAIENEGYIKKLLNVFRMCEDLDNMDGLHHLYEIFKNIFLLNKNALFELMFAEDTIFDVIGCLEFDPNLSAPKRHRQYLKSIAKFHQVININNPDLLSKIHQTYRVQYIQDVVLPTPSVFEENMLSTLSSFIFFNKVEIVSLIQEDEKFLTDLFNQLTDGKTEENARKESVLFLKEFCTFSQTLQPQSREAFFKTLSSLGILPALEITLASENRDTKAASIDILLFIVEFSPSMVREYMLQQLANSSENDTLFMNVIIEQMTCDTDPEMGGAVQLMVIIRTLLEPENMLASVNKSEKTDFLNYFYKHCMHVFIGAIRFMRKIIALKDEFYNRYIIKGNLFAPIIKAFISNNGRYNLLDSAVLEMFEFIKSEDIKSLCSHVVESFGPTLDKISYVQTFKALKLRYDQNQDRLRDRSQSQLESVGAILRPGRFRRDPRDLDEDEEMWFNDDEYDDQPGSNNGSGSSGSLSANSISTTMSSNLTGSQIPVGTTAATLNQQQSSPPESNGDSSERRGIDAPEVLDEETCSASDHKPPPALNVDDVDDEIVPEGDKALPNGINANSSRDQDSTSSSSAAKKGLVDYEEDSDEEDEEAASTLPTTDRVSESPEPSKSADPPAASTSPSPTSSSSSSSLPNGEKSDQSSTDNSSPKELGPSESLSESPSVVALPDTETTTAHAISIASLSSSGTGEKRKPEEDGTQAQTSSSQNQSQAKAIGSNEPETPLPANDGASETQSEALPDADASDLEPASKKPRMDV